MKIDAGQAFYYAVLGITSVATEVEIKRAYRSAARSHHPDLPGNRGNGESARRFREINEAYEVLSDPRKRMLYDRFGKKGLSEAYKDWSPPSKSKSSGSRRRREHSGADEPNTEAGSSVASIFEDLFSAAAPPPPKRNQDLWSPGGLDMGPVTNEGPAPIPGERGRSRGGSRGANRGGARGAPAPGATPGQSAGPFGPGGFSMSDLKEGLKAAAGYGGMSEGGGDASDGPAPAWADAMMGGPVDEEAFARDRGASMPRFHQQGGAGKAERWGPTDDEEWVDGAAGPAGWTESNAPHGWVRSGNAPRREPIPPEDQGPSRRKPVDAEFSASGWDRRAAPREPARTGDTLSATARIPLLTAVHGGRHTVTLRVPDAGGNWGLEAVEITVPPGMEEGGTMRLPGRGHHGDGGSRRGDLVLSLEIEPHPVFRLVGRDVHMDLPLSPSEAAMGCRVEVPTLFGTASVKVPPAVAGGAQVRLRGMGLPELGARGGKGDQLLTVQIHLPPRLSRQHLEWLERIEEETGFAPRTGLWDHL